MIKWLILFLSISCGAQTLPPGLFSVTTNAAAGAYNPATDPNAFELLDADVLSAGAIGSWPATIGANLTTFGGSQNPTCNANDLNGHKDVSFVAASFQTAFTASTFTTVNQPYTVFLVYKQTTSGQFGATFAEISGASRVRLINNSGTEQVNAGSSVNINTADTSWHIKMITFNGASSVYRIDGGPEIAYSNPGANAITSLQLANDIQNDFWDGKIAYWFGVNKDYSASGTSQASSVFTWLDVRYAIY